jgi:hypothetical protein
MRSPWWPASATRSRARSTKRSRRRASNRCTARDWTCCTPTGTTTTSAASSRCCNADLLWTKPSELAFHGALGLPLVFCPPIGAHEVYNRRWALESGAGLKQRDPRHAAEWIADWLHDGTLARAAWNGFMRLSKFGMYRFLDAVAVET